MNAAHLHLALNHAPVIGVFFGLVVLAIAALRASQEMTRLGLLLFAVSALIAVPVFLSGHESEEIIEDLAGVESARIEEHEEAALPAAVTIWVLGGVSLVALLAFRPPRALPRWLVAGVLLVSLVAAGLLARAGSLGGEIRHPEVREGFEAPRS